MGTTTSEISHDELGRRLFDGDDPPLVVDVRHAEAFEEGHVPGSENVDVYDDLREDPSASREALSRLPEEEIATACAAGVRSERATDHLRALGYDARRRDERLGPPPPERALAPSSSDSWRRS